MSKNQNKVIGKSEANIKKKKKSDLDVKEVLAGAGSQVRRRRPKRDRLPLKSVIRLSDVCDFIYLVLNKNRIVIKKKKR